MATASVPVLYFKRGCSTCERARSWLTANKVTVAERDIFRQPMSATEIEDLLVDRPAQAVLSTRSPEYKARGLNLTPHSDGELLRLMEIEPRLIRRPLLALADELLVGFDLERWTAALAPVLKPAH